MISNLRSVLDAISAHADWRVASVAGTRCTARWIPVMHFDDSVSMGLHPDGYWVCEVPEGIRELRSARSFLRVEILLEQPSTKVHENVIDSFNRLGARVEPLDVFPSVEIVAAVLENRSSAYWLELALQWFDQFPKVKQADLTDFVIAVRDDPQMAQRTRHRAGRSLHIIGHR